MTMTIDFDLLVARINSIASRDDMLARFKELREQLQIEDGEFAVMGGCLSALIERDDAGAILCQAIEMQSRGVDWTSPLPPLSDTLLKTMINEILERANEPDALAELLLFLLQSLHGVFTTS